MEEKEQQLFAEYEKYVLEQRAQGKRPSEEYLIRMRENLDPETRAYYEAVGKQMYAFDYETDGKHFRLKETAQRAVNAMRMGLRPRDLKQEEIQVLEEYLGKDWESTWETYEFS